MKKDKLNNLAVWVVPVLFACTAVVSFIYNYEIFFKNNKNEKSQNFSELTKNFNSVTDGTISVAKDPLSVFENRKGE